MSILRWRLISSQYKKYVNFPKNCYKHFTQKYLSYTSKEHKYGIRNIHIHALKIYRDILYLFSILGYNTPMTTKKRPQYEAMMIGKQIRFIRRSKDITQKDLAKQVQKTVAWIGRIERGEHLVNIRLLYKVSQALRVRV